MQRGDKPVLGKRPSTDKTLSQRLTTGVFHGIPAYLCAVVLLLVVLVGSVLFAVTVGSADLTVRQVYEVILFEWFHIGDPATLAQGAAHDIVWYIRLPRIVLGVAVGMGLATVGVVMQAVVQTRWRTRISWEFLPAHPWAQRRQSCWGSAPLARIASVSAPFWARWAYPLPSSGFLTLEAVQRRSNWSWRAWRSVRFVLPFPILSSMWRTIPAAL